MQVMTSAPTKPAPLPGADLPAAKMPGHWILARMGKRVLRPGGLELTRRLLDHLRIGPTDDVVEFAPGLGLTARLALARRPASYTGIDREKAAVARINRQLTTPNSQCLLDDASATGLVDASASVLYGEAMLSMQGPEQKAQIVGEAFRVLRPGGRYGIHELALVPNDVSDAVKTDIKRSLSEAIHVGVRPLTVAEWTEVLEDAGFRVKAQILAPMHLLEPRRVIQDEGLFRALRIVFNVLRTPEARRRVRSMRAVFRRHATHLHAVALVAIKP
jgi:SAM-dependent methyltransferase